MQKYLLAFFIFIFSAASSLQAQFSDNFNDGNFTANPIWTGSTADFIVNSSLQLQSNNIVANAAFYLSTASTKATTAQWDFYTKLTFNTSGTNYVDVFLTASGSDLNATATTGYFVRLGNTADEISLYRKDAGAGVTRIIDGLDGTLNSSNNNLSIRVIRNAANQWSLQRDLTGTASGFVTEGTVTDATFTTSAFFGISVRQSTASFFQRHFFDDIVVQDFVPDVTAPSLVSATAISATEVDVLFNEAVEATSSQVNANYVVNNAIGSPVSAVRDASNSSLVHLTFASALPPRVNLLLTVNAVKDIAGNAIANGTQPFSYFIGLPYDIVIDEIFADPTPQVGLPNNEWLELRNTTAFDINLQDWKLGKSTGISGGMPNYILKKDSFVIVCTGSAVAAMSAFGPTISVTSFPSLNNDEDLIYLLSKEGRNIHAVNYNLSWYQNELKKDGGWSLEMIDTKNPCTGMNNWLASVDARGGTPGKKNSIDAINVDNTAPKLVRAFATTPTSITLLFDENTDSSTSALAANYSISNGIGTPISAVANAPLFNSVTLTLGTDLSPSTVYTVTANGVKDCRGNTISSSANTALVGSFGNLLPFDVVVNEILFNPKSGEEDYVELYNRSNKIINLKNTYLANRNTTNVVSSITQISATDYAFFPGDYFVVTASKSSVLNNYVAEKPQNIIEVSSTPSYNDDKSNVIVLNEQGKIIDEIAYTDKWHFALISNKEGVALERINVNDTTSSTSLQQANWHSAASSVGFGTPTYKNSQAGIDAGVQGEISVTPEIISPDNDGFDDFATINYSFPQPGYVANITVFDAQGRPVRYLQRNALNGLKGFYRWDGLGEKNVKLPVGIYIIFVEVFNLEGKTKQFKKTIVLARRG